MNLARWSIDYIQKKSKAEPSPRPKSITDLVVEEREKKRQQSGGGTPEHVKRILRADEAQLDALTSERNQLFVKKPNQKSAPMVSTKMATPNRSQAGDPARAKNVEIRFKNPALEAVEQEQQQFYSLYGMKAIDPPADKSFPGATSQSLAHLPKPVSSVHTKATR